MAGGGNVRGEATVAVAGEGVADWEGMAALKVRPKDFTPPPPPPTPPPPPNDAAMGGGFEPPNEAAIGGGLMGAAAAAAGAGAAKEVCEHCDDNCCVQ